jgi:predicted DNA-binding transcriptional regulator AlpA
MFLAESELITTRTSRGRYPFSRGTLRSEVAAGRFPPPVRITKGRIAWDSAALDAYDAKLAATQRAAVDAVVAKAIAHAAREMEAV